ncbi:MAG TPA: hypothetical protein VHE35_32395 [Kofleriaceae bacterium]|nr:hypothetical protein [Kofleriaceae bacterium]
MAPTEGSFAARPARAAAWLRRRWWAIALATIYLYVFPYYPSIHSANELPRVYLVMSMADRGTFQIDDGVRRWGETVDVSPHAGHQYSNKAPGSSMAAVPGYLMLKAATRVVAGRAPTLAEIFWICRVTTGVLPTLLFLGLLSRYLARVGVAPGPRRATLALYALGSMAMTYSILFISHQLSAVCAGTAWLVAAEVIDDDARSSRWMLAAGFAAGAAPLCDYQGLFAMVPVAVWATVGLVRARRGPAPFGWAALGAVVPIAALLLYHDAAFGGPFKTGYGASQHFAMYHQRGLLGMDALRWSAFTGSTISADNGLVVFCPALLLAVPGWVALARRRRLDLALLSAAVAIIYLLFISSIVFWRGGWQMGPRYITAMLPFLVPAIAAALAWAWTRPPWRAAALGLAGVGVVVYAGSMIEFPHFPEKFHSPLWEVTLRLWGAGLAGPNLGRALGLPMVASLVVYAALVAAVWLRVALAGEDGRAAWRSPRAWAWAGAAAAVTVAIVLAYRGFHGGGRPANDAYRDSVAPAVAHS